jgi:hypothetical protein
MIEHSTQIAGRLLGIVGARIEIGPPLAVATVQEFTRPDLAFALEQGFSLSRPTLIHDQNLPTLRQGAKRWEPLFQVARKGIARAPS